MYVPGDCNILLIYVCDLCYRKKKLQKEQITSAADRVKMWILFPQANFYKILQTKLRNHLKRTLSMEGLVADIFKFLGITTNSIFLEVRLGTRLLYAVKFEIF